MIGESRGANQSFLDQTSTKSITKIYPDPDILWLNIHLLYLCTNAMNQGRAAKWSDMLLVLGHYILIEYGYRRGQGAARQAQKPSISRVHPEKLKRIDSDDVGGVRILCPSGRQVRKYARPRRPLRWCRHTEHRAAKKQWERDGQSKDFETKTQKSQAVLLYLSFRPLMNEAANAILH